MLELTLIQTALVCGNVAVLCTHNSNIPTQAYEKQELCLGSPCTYYQVVSFWSLMYSTAIPNVQVQMHLMTSRGIKIIFGHFKKIAFHPLDGGMPMGNTTQSGY